jgi:hypothetical protein
MPVVVYDPLATDLPIDETIHVWECQGRCGDYALCIKPQPPGPQSTDWKYRGKLQNIPELEGFPRPIIIRGTVNGWPMLIHRNPDGNYSF